MWASCCRSAPSRARHALAPARWPDFPEKVELLQPLVPPRRLGGAGPEHQSPDQGLAGAQRQGQGRLETERQVAASIHGGLFRKPRDSGNPNDVTVLQPEAQPGKSGQVGRSIDGP
jgi:hypothetical protein